MKKLIFLIGILIILTTTGFLLLKFTSTNSPQLKYELNSTYYDQTKIFPLSLQVQDNIVSFTIAFKSGGGNYEQARLVQSGNKLQIVLFDTDGKAEKMMVIYQLTGSISHLQTGNYILEITDNKSNPIAQEAFAIEY